MLAKLINCGQKQYYEFADLFLDILLAVQPTRMNTKYYKNLRAKSNQRLTSPDQGQKYPANSQNTLTKEETQPSATSPASPKYRAQVNNKNRNNNRELPPTQTKTIIEGEIIESRESSLTGNSVEKQQILYLEINQLKRENLFLRKKIQQLTNELDKECPRKKKTPTAKGHQGQPIIPSIQLSVNYFFKEISTLLNSVAKLFNLDLKDGQRICQTQYIPDIQNMQCPIEREYLFKKQVLNKKLQRISLQSQQQKYTSLLDIFEEYYRYKEEAELKITDSLDQMIQKTNQLNKQLLEKAQVKKIKSQIYSVSQKEGGGTPSKFSQNIKTPQITASIRLTFTPLPKNTYNSRKVSNSPH